MLEQRRFPVAGVAAEDDEPNPARPHVFVQRRLERRLDVGLLSEVAVEPARLPIPPLRSRIRLQQSL